MGIIIIAATLSSTVPTPGTAALDQAAPLLWAADVVAQAAEEPGDGEPGEESATANDDAAEDRAAEDETDEDTAAEDTAAKEGAAQAGTEEQPGKDVERDAKEEKLEDDMDRSREHLGHDHDHEHDHAPGASEDEKLEKDMDRARDHLGHEDAGGEEAEAEVDSPAIERKGPRARKRRRHRRSRRYPVWYDKPTIDGHSRGHYTVLGIIDWGLAGGAFLGALSTAIVAISWAAIGHQNGPLNAEERNPGGLDPGALDFEDRRLYKRDYRNLAAVTGLLSAGLGITAAILGWRGMVNLRTASELARQERMELSLYRRRRGME